MDLSKFYMGLCLVIVIEAASIPQYSYRQLIAEDDKTEALHKKAPIPILKQSFEQSKEGYQYSYDTGNGIHAEESGYIKNKGDEKHEVLVQQGTITYHDEHGKPISLTYIADEKGFRPQGAHLPTPPPIPDEILKSLKKNAQEVQQQEQQQEQHREQEHRVQVIQPAHQKEAEEEYQYQQPEQAVEYEAPQHQISQEEYQKLIQEQIQKQLREQPQQQHQHEEEQQKQQYYPQQEYRVQYHQAGY